MNSPNAPLQPCHKQNANTARSAGTVQTSTENSAATLEIKTELTLSAISLYPLKIPGSRSRFRLPLKSNQLVAGPHNSKKFNIIKIHS